MLFVTLLALSALVGAVPTTELTARSDVPEWLNKIGKRQGSYTMLRFGCPQIVIDRLDPLVQPGVNPSTHVHQIVGGNAFNQTMVTGDVSAAASCTSCAFTEDLSNYWTANVYFKAKNGTYKRVQQGSAALQFSDTFSNKMNGGILVYYVSPGPGAAATKVTVPKPGFRMVVGDPLMRKRPDKSLAKQLCFRCYTGPNFGGDTAAPCQGSSTLDTEAFPPKACAGGIRSNILFPTCWDGKNLDSPDHKSHVAYPSAGPATFLAANGACPSSHPLRIPAVMLEVVWDTTPFNNKADWPTDGSQPFYLSTGDNTGLGQHADYVFGWKQDVLQKAMDTSGCLGAKCGALKTQAVDVAHACTVTKKVNENVDGWITELPGIDMTQMK